MKTLKPVDTATHEKIGAAYVVCAQYPEIFGDVPLKKFCGMFVDVVDDKEDRMKAMTTAMYRLLKKIDDWCQQYDIDPDIEDELSEVLRAIESEDSVMSNELQVFRYMEDHEVRTTVIDGIPYFVGKDAAEALGYKTPQEAICEHVEEEDKGVSEILTPGGKQKMPVINESGVYSLIFASHLPTAKQFKHRVTSEVLPSIRKSGKFNIQLSPIPLPELCAEMRKWKEEKNELAKAAAYCKENMFCKIEDEPFANAAALKAAMKSLADKYGCNAIAIQCWNALQDGINIMPCAANSLLNEEGIPAACKTGIHGTISRLLAEAAAMNEGRVMFSDWTAGHPGNDNGELLQHCGSWPVSAVKEKPAVCVPAAFQQNGAVSA